MQIKLSKEDKLLKEIEIIIPSDMIEKKIEAHLQDAAKTTTVAGFRPGKVPLPVMKKKYGDVALEKAMDALIQEGTRKALTEHKVRPAMQPSLKADPYKEGKDFKFVVSVESLPEVSDVDVKGLTLKRYQVKLEDEKLQETLQHAQREFGETKELSTPRKSKEGDFVVIDFEGSVDGKKLEQGTATDYELQLGSKSFIHGFEEGLIGLKPGEKTTLKLKFPEQYHAADLAGKDVQFDVTVKAIKELVLAPLDEELAKKLHYKTVDEMKEGFKKRLMEEYSHFSRDVEKHLLLEELDKKITFDLPNSMVEAEFDVICSELQAQAGKHEKMPDEEKEKLKKEYYPKAEKRVKLGLILSDYARKNNLVVTPKELEAAVMERARSFPGQENQVIDYYNKNEQALSMLKAPILESKVVEHIVSQSKEKPEEVTVEALKKMLDNS